MLGANIQIHKTEAGEHLASQYLSVCLAAFLGKQTFLATPCSLPSPCPPSEAQVLWG